MAQFVGSGKGSDGKWCGCKSFREMMVIVALVEAVVLNRMLRSGCLEAVVGKFGCGTVCRGCGRSGSFVVAVKCGCGAVKWWQ